MRILEYHSQGYTLIELVVAIGIMVMLTGSSIAGYIAYNERQQVRNVTDEIVGFLESAKQKAVVRQRPEDCTFLRGYEVSSSELGLAMYALCSETSDGNYEVQSVPISSIELSQLVTVNTISISFLTLYDGVIIDQPSNGEIDISFGDTMQTILISEGGAIEVL